MKLHAAAAALLAVSVSSLTACFYPVKIESPDAETNVSVSQETDSSSEAVSEEDTEIIASADTYSVYHAYLKNEEGISIAYPQIKGLEDSALQDKINSQLYDLESGRYEASGKNYESYARVNYCDCSVLSLTQIALFNGGSLETGGYSLTHVNLDMETGEKLVLEEIADLNEMSEKIFSRQGIVITDGYDGADIEDFFSLHRIESAQEVYEYFEGSSFYIDENKNIVLGFSTENGRINAYVE